MDLDWDHLNFSRNCTVYGQWLHSYITTDPADHLDGDDSSGGSIALTLALVQAAHPTGWFASWLHNTTAATAQNASATTAAYYGQVLAWYAAQLFDGYNATDGRWTSSPDFDDHVVWQPAVACPAAFCRAVSFTGNVDLSGIGMLTSYCIEAVLVTVYLVAFSLARGMATTRHGRRPRLCPWPGLFCRLFDALRGALLGFLTSASLFALAVLVAAIVLAARQTRDQHSRTVGRQTVPTGSALYNPVLALLVSLFAVWPVVILHLIVPEVHVDETHTAARHPSVLARLVAAAARCFYTLTGRRTGSRAGLRRALLVLLWALTITIVLLSPHSELDYRYQGHSSPGDSTDDDTFADVLYACDARGGIVYWRILHGLPYLVVGLPLLWLVATAALHWLSSSSSASYLRSSSSSVASFASLIPLWSFATAWLACALMWTDLVCFVFLRTDIVATAGDRDADDEWAFGQVLAIANWVPVLADLAYLLVFGLDAGLASRLPVDFTVRHVTSFLAPKRDPT